MKTNTLTDMLEMRGWGALNDVGRKGTRAALRALVLCLPFGSGEGYATVPQVAHKAGYSSRYWVGEMLADLEGLGLIEWRRGGVYHGEPVPSYFRINKQMLADLVNAAREQCEAELMEMRIAMRQRLEKWRHVRYIASKKRNPRPENPQAPQRQSGGVHGLVGRHPTPTSGEAPTGVPHPGRGGTPSGVPMRSASRAHSRPQQAAPVSAGAGRRHFMQVMAQLAREGASRAAKPAVPPPPRREYELTEGMKHARAMLAELGVDKPVRDRRMRDRAQAAKAFKELATNG